MTKAEPKLVSWPIEKLVPYDENAKIHSSDQIEKLAKSIEEFGWTAPISVDKDGVIIGGHGRRLAAKHLGMKKVPVLIRDDLTPEEVRALRLADNRVTSTDYDTEKLQEELAALSDMDIDMSAMGFDDNELDFMTSELGDFDADAFTDSIEEDVERQQEENEETVAALDNKPVSLVKALGFKEIPGRDERMVRRFIAQAEEETGKKGADAFVAFLDELMPAA